MTWTAERALDHWQEEGLLTKQKATELRASLPQDDAVPHRAIQIFSALGGILIGLGVILFVASNWTYLSPLSRVSILMAGMLGTGFAGYYYAYRTVAYPKTGFALLFVNAMVYGASIFLVAQIYHLPLNYWWGMLLWFLGMAYFAYVLQSRLHLWVAVPIFLFFIGWFRSTLATGFGELSFLFEPETNLLGIMPAIGIGVVSAGLLHRDHERTEFGSGILFNWGMFLVLLPMVIGTIDREVFFPLFHMKFDMTAIVIAVIAALLTVTAAFTGNMRTEKGRWSLLFLLGYIAFTYVIAWAPYWIGLPENHFWGDYTPPMVTGLFVLHTLLVFVLLLTVTWYGTLLRKPAIINMGIAGLGIAVIIQYFSWAFEMLDRSIAFILGGVLILILSALLERKRRTLVFAIR